MPPLCQHGDMSSTPPGNPASNDPHVPPPPGQGGYGPPPQGGFDQTRPPQGGFDQGGVGQGGYPGQGPQGQPTYGQPAYGQQPGGYAQTQPLPQHGAPQPYGASGEPPKKSNKGLLTALAIGLPLLLLGLCLAGWLVSRGDDDSNPTSSTTSSTTTSSSTSATSSTTTDTATSTSTTAPTTSSSAGTSSSATSGSSSAGGAAFAFPESFDGWTKIDYSATSGTDGDVGAYTKGGKGLSIVVTDEAGIGADDLEAIWTKPTTVGDVTCGEFSGATQCATDKDGSVVLLTATGGEDVKTTAGYLEEFLKAV